MKIIRLHVEKCVQRPDTELLTSDLFLDFVDENDFQYFKTLCKTEVTSQNEDCSMLCVLNTNVRLKEGIIFEVPASSLARLRWNASETANIRYELDGHTEDFANILTYRKPRW